MYSEAAEELISSEGLIYPNTKVTLPQVYALISVYLKRDLKEIYAKGLSPWQKETLRILEKKASLYV